MGLFSKLFKGPEPDMEKSTANAKKVRALFDKAVEDGEEYRLIVQHLLYRTKEIEGKGRDVGVIQLDPQDYALDEVVVKAERPFVKVEEGRLGYDLSVLAGDGVVNNAYEALTKLPGVKETKGVLTLAGTGNLTVVLNGKPTTMDAGQLETLLRNTPLDRVEKAEVMYSAPPEYHVR